MKKQLLADNVEMPDKIEYEAFTPEFYSDRHGDLLQEIDERLQRAANAGDWGCFYFAAEKLQASMAKAMQSLLQFEADPLAREERNLVQWQIKHGIKTKDGLN